MFVEQGTEQNLVTYSNVNKTERQIIFAGMIPYLLLD